MRINSVLHGTEAGVTQKISVILVDDINGGEAEETVEFGLDGTSYEIDLSLRNSQELRNLLKPYIEKGRKVTSGARRPRRSRTASGDESNKKIRAWAKEQGLKVSERGRVPAEIVARYEAAGAR
jgi:Lsr2